MKATKKKKKKEKTLEATSVAGVRTTERREQERVAKTKGIVARRFACSEHKLERQTCRYENFNRSS